MIMRFFALIVIFTISWNCLSLPTYFDLRVQPSLIRYADYTLKPQGTCVAHSWGLQLAQIFSNAVSLQLKSKFKLSSQHLIQCITSKNQLCHDATLENIQNAIDYIQKQGLTTTQCIKNKIFDRPREFCPRECDNGNNFQFKFKANITKHESFEETLTTLTDDELTSGFVIVKVFDQLNYYSSEKPQNLDKIGQQNYGYRVGQIIGWRNKGADLIVRLGSGQGWGYNGFGYLNANKHKDVIMGKYTVKLSGGSTRIQKGESQLIDQ